MTKTATNGDGKYVYYSGSNGTFDHRGLRRLRTARGPISPPTELGRHLGFRYWNEGSGHHNLPMKSWTSGKDKDYALFHLPAQRV